MAAEQVVKTRVEDLKPGDEVRCNDQFTEIVEILPPSSNPGKMYIVVLQNGTGVPMPKGVELAVRPRKEKQ